MARLITDYEEILDLFNEEEGYYQSPKKDLVKLFEDHIEVFGENTQDWRVW